MNIAQALAESSRLSSESARLDVECLLQWVLAKDRSYLYTWPETELSAEQAQAFVALLARRERGEPVAYLTGSREFWSLPLRVTAATLIPRPETELLVELALRHVDSPAPRILDLGTGSGAIALALGSELPQAHIVGVDQSEAALHVAKHNADALGLAQVTFAPSDWYSAVADQRFDLIVSNPPYIETNDPHLRDGDVRYEPLTALVSGEDGLDDIRHIVQQAHAYARPRAWLMLEHGYQQGSAVRDLLAELGFTDVRTECDLAGLERITLGKLGSTEC